MAIIIYTLSFGFTLVFGLIAMSLFDLDPRLRALYWLSIYPFNLLFYLPGLLIYFMSGKNLYLKYKLLVMVSPNVIGFLFWFGGAIVYNYFYSNVDLVDFVIFGVPNFIWLVLLLAFRKLVA